jgi:subtilase family protein
MLPPPQGRPPRPESFRSAGPLTLVLLALAAGCGGGGDNVGPAQRTIALKDGNAQSAATGTAVPIAPSVTVTEGGSPVSGVAVTFQVTSGGGTVSPATPVNTDAQGTAAVTSWTLGTAAGANTLSATAAGVTGSPIVFTATGLTAATISGTITVSNEPPTASAGVMSTRPRPSSGARPALRRQAYTPDELIVRFRRGSFGALGIGASTTESRSAAAALGGRIRARMARHLAAGAAALAGVSPAMLAARIRVTRPAELEQLSRSLRTDPSVASVERNSVGWAGSAASSSSALSQAAAPTRPNDPFGPHQAWHYGMIDLPEAWSITTGSAGALVATVDDGIRFDHPDIAANLTSDGFDFVADRTLSLCSGGNTSATGDGDEYDDDPTMPTSNAYDVANDCLAGPYDLSGLGVAAAGIIGAVGNDGAGIAGINWSVRIRPVRVLGIDGVGTGYDVAQGILYAAGLPADDGAGGSVKAPTAARIINLNLSSPEDDAVVRDAVAAASGAGALVVAPSGILGSSTPEYPAAYPEVLGVSALTAGRELAAYSSFGSTVDIAAPGGDFPNDDATFGALSTAWDFPNGQPAYAFWQFVPAVPHVVGVAALVLAQNPGMTAAQLRSRLTDYAVDAGAPGRDDRYGAGILNARNSLAQNLAPPRQLHARLYDASAGGVVQTVAVAADGSYSFTVTPGSYQVFAGQDESGDGLIGLPGRRWGAFGGAGTPSPIDVQGSGSQKASFTIGFPFEKEPNEAFTVASATPLPVGGYLLGLSGDDDVFRVQIPAAGQYTFETSAVDGACGFALEENTTLGVYRSDETAVGFSEDLDPEAFNFCAGVTATLQPGSYYVRVQGSGGGGRYQVQARSGP